MNRSDFDTRVRHWAARLRVRPVQVRVQSMTRKWGSCSPQGRVSFARDLLDQKVEFQDYVIAHELLHLRIRNHGKLFNATLRAHLRGNPWLSSNPDNAPTVYRKAKIPLALTRHKLSTS